MAYTTINKSTDYFNTKLYTGNGGTQSITGVGFQPDWIWNKTRNGTGNHVTFDAVRGTLKRLKVSTADAETSSSSVTSFDSDGYGLGGEQNGNGVTYASWNWKANGAGSANTDGSIKSTVSVNTTAGFSIATFTTLNSTISTVGHGLGVVPDMYIVKTRANSNGWFVYHKDIGNTKFLRLETTGAETANAMWNNTSPTSDVFTINANNFGASTSVAYCFAEKQGYSKFGSYTGNSSLDGPFIYTGFKPAFVMLKKSNAASYWSISDNKRVGYNGDTPILRPNTNEIEADIGDFDLLSNGFKIRSNTGNVNGLNNSYIYMAFAEAPIVGTNGVTAKAR